VHIFGKTEGTRGPEGNYDVRQRQADSTFVAPLTWLAIVHVFPGVTSRELRQSQLSMAVQPAHVNT